MRSVPCYISVLIAPVLIAGCVSQVTGGSRVETPGGRLKPEAGRDQAVLCAFLRYVLALPPETAQLLPNSGFQIILHERTPEKTGMIQPPQWKSYDTGDKVSKELYEALLARNVEAPPYEARYVSYRTMDFAPPILLADVRAAQSSRCGEFEKKFPEARAWVEAFLPAYPPDGSHALVAAWIGPTPHGAFALATLDKKGKDWKIAWFRIYWFA